jgi:hypothetical protein
MKHTVLTVLIATAALVATGCGTMTPADCQLQSSANGPYALKFSQAGGLAAGCTTTDTPDVFGDLWLFDPYADGLIVAYPISGPLPDPPDPHDAVYGKGKFTSQFPGGDNLCTVPDLKNDAAGPMTIAPGVSYTPTNLQFLSTALYLGTTFQANVTFTNGACSRPYTVQAINPAHVCATKEDCDPFSQPFASGVNSAYDTDCNTEQWAQDQAAILGGDPGTGICFFVGAFPGLGGWKPVQ